MSRIFGRQRPLHLISPQEARQAHQEGSDERLIHGSAHGEHVGDFVFGGIDGVVTTFAVVAGVAGADLSAAIVLVLGLANLLADGFAMGIGNFLSIRSERERYERERARETWEVEHIPEEERKEITAIYAAKGFSGELLHQVVTTITADKERWVDTMLQEEHGLARETRSPLKGGAVTYFAFIIIGFIPLLTFVVALFADALKPYTFPVSVALTAIALFAIGALKTLVVARPFWRSGLETLLMGGLAALVAYVVGYLLRGIQF
ncbi:MAG: VIT1/CCC1 transporter family protein [Candidatus Andersenbacteria bacterium]